MIRLVAALTLLSTGCFGISGIRNSPVRNRMRSASQVVDRNYANNTITVQRVADVEDKQRPLGFGVGGKTGVAYGGSSTTAHAGYAQDFNVFLAYSPGAWYVAPQIAFTMNIHGSDMGMGRGQLALSLPVELDAGYRVADRLTLYVGGGRSIWGRVTDADLSEPATYYRGRGGLMYIVRNGGWKKWEVTMRFEGFGMTGSGTTLDYSAVGGLLQLDFTGTGSGY